jgi:preprotein translocase subunit SecE
MSWYAALFIVIVVTVFAVGACALIAWVLAHMGKPK